MDISRNAGFPQGTDNQRTLVLDGVMGTVRHGQGGDGGTQAPRCAEEQPFTATLPPVFTPLAQTRDRTTSSMAAAVGVIFSTRPVSSTIPVNIKSGLLLKPFQG